MSQPNELVDWKTFGYMRKGFFVELGTQMDRGQGSLAFAIAPEHAIKLHDGRLVVWLEEADREALACLALHRRKWGFTPEDVDFLYSLMNERVDNIADRIAALLPPAK